MIVNGIDSSVVDAVNRLNRDIAEAEERVAQLRAMRDSIQPFIEQYIGVSTTPSTSSGESADRPSPPQGSSSITDEVIGVFHEFPDRIFELDEVVKVLRSKGSDSAPVQIRNAINYAVRMGKAHRGPRRGTYTLKKPLTQDGAEVSLDFSPDRG